MLSVALFLKLRRERDSNPRIVDTINGFRDRPIRPLWHLSYSESTRPQANTSTRLDRILTYILLLSYFKRNFTDSILKNKSDFLQSLNLRGERGIRTPGTLLYNGFQDRRIRPLCHFSAAKIQIFHFAQMFQKKNFIFCLTHQIKAVFLYS